MYACRYGTVSVPVEVGRVGGGKMEDISHGESWKNFGEAIQRLGR